MHVISHLGLSGGSWVDTQVGHRRVWQTLPSVPKFWPEQAVLSHIHPHAALLHPLSTFAGVLQSAIPPATLGHLWQGRCVPSSLTRVPNAPLSFAGGTKLPSSLTAPDVSYKSIPLHIFTPVCFQSFKLPAPVPLGSTQVSYPYVQMEITFELKIHGLVYELLIWPLRCRLSTTESCLNW